MANGAFNTFGLSYRMELFEPSYQRAFLPDFGEADRKRKNLNNRLVNRTVIWITCLAWILDSRKTTKSTPATE
jgi:hypothetical protein